MKILMIGDIVGKNGRLVVNKLLPSIKKKYNIDFNDIEALLLTHDHNDHTKEASYFMPSKIFCAKGTYEIPSENELEIYESYFIAGFKITVLATSHDATNPVGFILEADDEKLVYMTDTGYVSEKNMELMKNPDYLCIESNHNVKMLFETNRPAVLIKRIIGDFGHLSNEDSAIKIISVGKIKERYFVDAINEYSKRLLAYCDLEMLEVQDESISKNSNDSLDKIIKEKEGEKILTKIKPGEYIILLDFEKSKEYDSISFSKHIEDLMCSSQSRITFVIGGSLGLGENIRKVAKERMLLSKMTFTHQMTKVILLEQIYRAFKILNHETYHK